MVDAPRDLGTSHSEAEEDFRHLTDAQAKILFFTFDLYGHLIPSAHGDVVRRLNASQERAETG
jgi:hypothetical protein